MEKYENYKPRNKHIMAYDLSVKLIKLTVKSKLGISL